MKLDFKRVARTRSLPDEVADALKHRLATAAFAPGEKLPTGAELAAAFGVSLSVIREALSRLKHEGLIETVQGAGAFVSRKQQARSFRIADGALDDVTSLTGIFELRQAVESEAARLAAGARTAEDLAGMQAAMEAMDLAVSKGEDGSAADVEFHRIIAKATGNAYFMEFCSFLDSHLRSSIATARTNSSQTGFLEQAKAEHLAIFRAIEASAPEEAHAASMSHVRNAGHRLGLVIR